MFFNVFGRRDHRLTPDGQGAITVGRAVRIPWSGWRKFYVIGCVVLVLAAGVSSFFLWRANTHAHKAKFDGEAAVQSAVLLEAQRDDHAGKYDDEATVLKNYLKTHPPQQYRYEPLMTLGNLAYNKRDDAGALKYYKQAVVVNGGKLTAFDAESIAQAAQAAGDKATAIQYYKQAIRLTKVQPGVANNVDELKQIIVHLGGTP